MDCIFCRIIRGDIPSYKLYEDEHILAILDISQATRGHTLIISKKHLRNLYELDEQDTQDVFRKLPRIANALKKAFDPIGLNVLINTEKPLQSVFHFHIHLIPRYADDKVKMDFENNIGKIAEADYRETLEKIKENL